MILLDTSALAKLLVEEKESVMLRSALSSGAMQGETFAISRVAVVELQRLCIRLDLAPEHVRPVLQPFHLLRLTEAMMLVAARLPYRQLGTLDALHVATALTAEARGLMTYDIHQSKAAEAEGLAVSHPGR